MSGNSWIAIPMGATNDQVSLTMATNEAPVLVL